MWLRVAGTEARSLREGDSIWLGAQLLVLSKSGATWQLEHYDGDGVLQGKHAIEEQGLIVGKKSAVPLDAKDASLSRRHAAFRVEGVHQSFQFLRVLLFARYLWLRDPLPAALPEVAPGASVAERRRRALLGNLGLQDSAGHAKPAWTEWMRESAGVKR